MTELRRVQPQTAEEARREDAVAEALRDLASDDLLDTVEISAELASGDNDVPHKLGRAWRGWLVADIDAAATLYRKASPDEERFLRLNASAACNVVLRVY